MSTEEGSAEVSPGKPLVAVVDDDGVIVDSLVEALEDAGFATRGHTDPQSALTALLGNGSCPEVFLLDLVMPGMDGVELCRRLRTEHSLAESTIVIMTGQVAQERLDAEILRAMEAGADDYLVKPFGTGEFIARMHAWLRTGRARRNADKARRCSEARYRALYESTRDAVMLLDAQGFFDCNDATVRIFGCRDKAEFCTKHPADLSPPRQPDGADSLALAGERIAEAMERGSLFFEWVHRRQDTGADFPAEVLLSALELDGRRVLQALVRDISERKRDDDALRERETYYRMLFEDARDGKALADAETGILVDCNKALCRLIGRDKAELVGQPHAILHPPSGEAGGLSPSFRQHQAGQAGLALEDRLLSKSGEIIPVEITAARIRIRDRDHLLGIFRDIRERRVLEEQLRRAQKLEAIGQLAGGVAHEFNNILMGVSGHAQLLLADCDPGSDAAKDLGRIRALTERGARLAQSLLAFSRRQPGKPEVFSLNVLVEGAHKMLKKLLPENIALELRLDANAGKVHGDPGQLEQVLVNLLLNARDAMPGGGLLTISTRSCAANSARKPACLRSDRCVVLEVADTGVGMDEDTRGRIFEPFFTTKEVGKGTGLGLPTVYGIIEQHGGCIDVESEEGRGSTFRVFLPLHEGLAAPVEAASAAEEARRGGGETILLVEDEEAVRAVVGNFLTRSGYQVIPASVPSEAEAAFRERGGRIDLLISDFAMPEMSGDELYRRLSDGHPDLKVLFISAHPEGVVRREKKLMADVPLLQKPFSLVTLAAKARSILAERPHGTAGASTS